MIAQQHRTATPEETEALFASLGRALAAAARDAVVVLGLDGPLGAGKTHAVRGLVRGVDPSVADWVSSPTYAVLQAYPGDPPIAHLDVYRLEGADDLESVGFWDLLDEPGVVAVEWPTRVAEVLEALDIAVTIARDPESRSFTIEARSARGDALLSAWVAAEEA